MRRRVKGTLVALGLIAVLILVGAAVALALSGNPGASTAQLPDRASISTGSAPDAASNESAASAAPGPRIRIERLGIDLPITEGDGIDAPLDSAAHFPGSGWPGDGTNIYVYGHARDGLFIRLKEAQAGDRIVLTMPDGSDHPYAVTKVIPDVPWNAMEYLEPTPTEQLTLQTSTSESETDPRLIVIAAPL